MNRKTFSDYARIGGNAKAHKHVIEGRYYTTAQIVERSGFGATAVRRKLSQGINTWEGLTKPKT